LAQPSCSQTPAQVQLKPISSSTRSRKKQSLPESPLRFSESQGQGCEITDSSEHTVLSVKETYCQEGSSIVFERPLTRSRKRHMARGFESSLSPPKRHKNL